VTTKSHECSQVGTGNGIGCPGCKRFEVRIHVVDCPEHGEHLELSCCACGFSVLSFRELVEHEEKTDASH
jgi:hypothetical protein